MSSPTDLDGKAAIVTGAGAGLGRAEALALADRGAAVVVNDIGADADAVAAEITARGGRAVAVRGDVGDWATGPALVDACVDAFGALDAVVNNAGVLRDRMVFNLDEKDWDDVMRVHLKGHAALSRAATAHWRARSKAAGAPVDAAIVNTSSEAFLFGGAGQPNYAAAKAGITALTLSTAQGMQRYGVRANAICPRARTAMTAGVLAGPDGGDDGGGLDVLAPERVGTFVAYLVSPAAAAISGQVFVVYGGMVALMAAPEVETRFDADGGAFTADGLHAALAPYFADRDPARTYAAYSVAELDDTGVGNTAAPR